MVGPGDSLKGHHPRAAILKSSGPWVAPGAQAGILPQRVDANRLSLSPHQSQGCPVTPAGASSAPGESLGARGGRRARGVHFLLSAVPATPWSPVPPCSGPQTSPSTACAPGLTGGSIPASAPGTGSPLGLLENSSCWCPAGRPPAAPSLCPLCPPPIVVPCRSQWVRGSRPGTGQQAHRMAARGGPALNTHCPQSPCTHPAESNPDPLGSRAAGWPDQTRRFPGALRSHCGALVQARHLSMGSISLTERTGGCSGGLSPWAQVLSACLWAHHSQVQW